MKFKITIIALLFGLHLYAQPLTDEEVKLEKLKFYSKVDGNIFGELLNDISSTANILVMELDNKTVISFEHSLFGNSRILYYVTNIDKEVKDEITTYFAKTYEITDREKKPVEFIIEYVDNKISRFTYIMDKNTAVFY